MADSSDSKQEIDRIELFKYILMRLHAMDGFMIC